MVIVDGQFIDATNSNAAWVSKTANDSKSGTLTLAHPTSGGTVSNVQQSINTLNADVATAENEIVNLQTDVALKIYLSEKGAASGVAPLNASTKIDATYLPSYVDDVLEYANLAGFPVSGETGKIYVAIDTGLIYRWSGSIYVEISTSAPAGANNYLSNLTAPTAVNVDIKPGTTDTISAGSLTKKFTEVHSTPATLGIATGLTPSFWGTDLSGIVIDGSTTYATTVGYGAGIIFKGGNTSFVIASQDRADLIATADIYLATGINTGGAGSGSQSHLTGDVNSGSASGGFTYASGANPGGGTGSFAFTAGASSTAANRGVYSVDAGQLLFTSSGPNGISFQQTGTGDTTFLTNASDIILGVKSGYAVKLKSNDTIAPTQLNFYNAANTFYASIKAPALSANYNLTLPVDDGAASQVLTTDGSGVLSWTTPGGGGANTALSNLASTLINVDLRFDTGGPATIKTKDVGNGSSQNISLKTGGCGTGGATGDVSVSSANNDQAAGTGAASLRSGVGIASCPSGNVSVYSGSTVDGNAGNVFIGSGVPTGTGSRGYVSIEGLFMNLPTGSGDPSGVVAGSVYYNTTSNKIKMYNGSTWETVTSI